MCIERVSWASYAYKFIMYVQEKGDEDMVDIQSGAREWQK
jgi:hypothetical protein